MSKNFTFTSESVCQGHPDKICDSISDSILDEVLKQDSKGRVAIETLVAFEKIVIAGEVTSNAKIDYELIARKRIKDLGYTDDVLNFTNKSDIQVYVHEQSREIAKGVNKKGAGDQGMMFGFACLDNKNLMPLPITIAHALAQRIDYVREKKILNYLRPDGKTQVTIEYKNGLPYKILQVVVAVPHKENIKIEQVKKDIYEFVVKNILNEFGFKINIKD